MNFPFDFVIHWNVEFQCDQSDKELVDVNIKGPTKKRTQKVQTAQELLIKQKRKEKRWKKKRLLYILYLVAGWPMVTLGIYCDKHYEVISQKKLENAVALPLFVP